MTKPLTDNELIVLQENFDLFETPGKENDPKKAPRRPSKRTAQKQRKQLTDTLTDTLEIFDIVEAESFDSGNSKKNSSPEIYPAKTGSVAINKEPKELPESATKLLAIRAANGTEAVNRTSEIGSAIIDYSMEKRDPALKNLAQALFDRGMEYKIDSQSLHWVLAEDKKACRQLLDYSFVELALCSDWFESEKRKIRELKGIAYIDACTELANNLELKSQTRSL